MNPDNESNYSIPIPNPPDSLTQWSNECKAQWLRQKNSNNNYTPPEEYFPGIVGGPSSKSPQHNNAFNPSAKPPTSHSSSPQKPKPVRVSPQFNQQRQFQPQKAESYPPFRPLKDMKNELEKLKNNLQSINDDILKLASEIIINNEALKPKNGNSTKDYPYKIADDLYQIVCNDESLEDWIQTHKIQNQSRESIKRLITLEEKKCDLQKRISKLEEKINPPQTVQRRKLNNDSQRANHLNRRNGFH